MPGKTDWRAIERDVIARYESYKKVRDKANEYFHNPQAASEIAAVDTFLEKAQTELNRRSQRMGRLGTFYCFLAVAAVAFGLFFVLYLHSFEEFWASQTGTFNSDSSWRPYMLGLYILRAAEVLGLAALITYVFLSLGRAYLHEGAVAFNRRHSVRLGRIYTYLKLSSVNEQGLKEFGEKLDAKQLVHVFGWNIETDSAFRDIRANVATKTLFNRLIDAATEIVSRQRPSHKDDDDDHGRP